MTNQFLVHKKTHPSQPRTTQLRAKPRPEFLSVSRNSLHVSSPTSKITCQSMSPSLAESNAKFGRKILVASPKSFAPWSKKMCKNPMPHTKMWRDKNPESRHPESLAELTMAKLLWIIKTTSEVARLINATAPAGFEKTRNASWVRWSPTFCYLSLNPGWLKRDP